MIRSFADKKTEQFFGGENLKEFSAFSASAERKLAMLDAAAKLGDLASPPGNKLEALGG